jgi:hypothetical protein
VAKLYDKGRPSTACASDPEALATAIEDFLKASRRPAVLDYGENAVALVPGEYALETRAGRLWIEFWCGNRSISRRILAIERKSAGMLECAVQRFGGKTGTLSFLDLDRPQTAHKMLAGTRRSFAERFRQMLSRQFPGWEIEALSCAMDLQRSFSPVFPRAHLVRGNQQIAALACPGAHDEPALLTFALIWFAYIATRTGAGVQTSLALFLPEQAGTLTAHRLRWLQGPMLRTSLFRFNEHGSAGQVDPQDLGNLETRVSPQYLCPRLTDDCKRLLARLTQIEGVGWSPELDGAISIRSRGLEFARIENSRILLGVESKREAAGDAAGSVEEFAHQLARMHSRIERSRTAPGLPAFPERWLEQRVRSNLGVLDASLLTEPVQGQVLTFAGGDRDLIDLLAADASGRLAVLELKATEDVHLPMQALDYWMRVRWHAEREELGHLFPGLPLDRKPPRLLLIAPAISFHSSNATVLRYFSPEIEVERIGINSEWQEHFKVVLRLEGSEPPQSHGRPI